MRTFRAVVVSGPRQAGKTTMLGQVENLSQGRLVSFDDAEHLEWAEDDPMGFVGGFERPLAIDEFQRAGNGILLAVKYHVDRSNRRGQFVLAGSTNFLANMRLADTLAGRVGLVDVLPLSRGEILGVREQFIDRAFDAPRAVVAAARKAQAVDRRELARLVAMGGYPEAVHMEDGSGRADFLKPYVETVTGREVLADVGALRTRRDLRGLLRMLAARTACEHHATRLAGEAGISRPTLLNYVELLHALHLVLHVPAWFTNATKRARRAPKLYMVDTGLASYLTRSTEAAMRQPDHRLFGQLLETYAVTELIKARAWAEERVELFHFRDQGDREIDLLLEADDGRIVAVEVKAASAVTPKAFTQLRYLRDRVGDRFAGGYVLYGGNTVREFDAGLWALPISTLWAE